MSRPKQTRLNQLQGQRNQPRSSPSITAATVALSELRQGDRRLIALTVQNGQAFTLPFATGKGSCYRFFQQSSVTSNTNTYATQAGNNPKTGARDALYGVIGIASSGTPNGFTSTGAAHTITSNGSTQGGLAGSYLELEDVAPGFWRVRGTFCGSGVAATPFS